MQQYKTFKSLDQNRKAQILWQDGVFLDLIRETSQLTVELYALNGFYVELYFDRHSGEPLFLKPFSHPRYLGPYLKMIDITDILDSFKNGLSR